MQASINSLASMYHEIVLEDLHTFHIPLQQWIEKVHPDYPAVYLEFDMGA